MAGCGAEDLANELLTDLVDGEDAFDVTLPDFSSIDFQVPAIGGTGVDAPIARLTVNDLTEGIVNGAGVFDRLMAAMNAQLTREFEAGRISGIEYTKAYIASTEAAFSNATQFLLGRDQAYWQAVTAQVAAQTAKIQLVTARVQLESEKAKLALLKTEGLVQKANFGLTKMKIATESMTYCTGKYNLEEILPVQKRMLSEQAEAARAQTMDTRSDGTVVEGSVGSQKDLYAQQILSYQRDAEIKAAKIWTDTFIAMKTIDEGLAPPTNFANAQTDLILDTIKTANGFQDATP